MAGNESASRRVSTSTTAPIAPWIRSSHMNQNRCCPGVPNRYRISSASSVTRPKSIATVVVVLSGVSDRSSRPFDAEVITASVVSGVISDTDPTNVVLPAPKPPATTIFTEVMAESAITAEIVSEPAKSTEHPFQQLDGRAALSVIELVDPHVAFHRHVSDQDPRHPQRHLQHRGDLGHRPPIPAELQNRLAFWAKQRQIARPVVFGHDHRLDLQLIPRLCPPSRHRIRPNQKILVILRRVVVIQWRMTAIASGHPVIMARDRHRRLPSQSINLRDHPGG